MIRFIIGQSPETPFPATQEGVSSISRLLARAVEVKREHIGGMGDLFMSLIHTCELNEVNAFDYLSELLRHMAALKQNPSAWMPWNYRDTLARLATPAAAEYDGD